MNAFAYLLPLFLILLNVIEQNVGFLVLWLVIGTHEKFSDEPSRYKLNTNKSKEYPNVKKRASTNVIAKNLNDEQIEIDE